MPVVALNENETWPVQGATLCAVAAIAVGSTVLAGWQFDLPALRTVAGGWSPVQPLCAVGFVVAGAALGLVSTRWFAALLVPLAAIALIAGSTLWESWADTEIGVDKILYPAKIVAQALPHPGRMGETIAAEFLLFCAAVLMARAPEWQRPFMVTATLGTILPLFALSGYLFGPAGHRPPPFLAVIGNLALFVGLQLSQPGAGLMALLLSPRLGGVVARRTLPAAVAVPLLIFWMAHAATDTAPKGYAMALAVPSLITALVMAVAGFARTLDAADRQRQAVIEAMRQSEQEMRATQDASMFGLVILDAVRDADARITDFRHRYVNPAALRLMGIAATDPAASANLSRCAAHADGTLFRKYLDVMETGRPMDREFSTAKPGGPQRWFRAVAVKLEHGIAVSFYETTEQKEAERGLARAEARHRSVVDSAVDAIVVIDGAGVIRSFNRAAEHMFGFTAAEAVGQPATILIPDHLRDGCLRGIADYQRTGVRTIIGSHREMEAMRRDGTTFPVDLSVAEWFDGDQRFFTGIMRDVTLRQQARIALESSEARYRSIFEQAAVGIMQVGLDGRVLEINHRLCEMLGYRRDEMFGRHFEEFSDPATIEAERTLLGELLTGRRDSYFLERRHRGGDCSARWLRVTSSLYVDSIAARIAIFEDITAQKQALDDLQETAGRLELALEGARAGTWEMDLRTGQSKWSEAMYRLAGLDPAVPASFDYWLTALAPEDRPRIEEDLAQLLERRDERFAVEYRVITGHGPVWLSATGKVTYAEDGSPLRIAGIAIDVTETKRAEAEARAAKEEAERANRAKSRFLASASHDLRQPVQAMVLLSSALSNRLQDHPASGVVANMQASLKALQMLLDGLLDVSRLDAGVVEAHPEPIALGECLDRIAGEYAIRAASKGIAFRTVPTSLWAETDPVLFERIVRNLLENALRYTENGRLLLGCRRAGGRVRVHVCDTGIGIAPEHQQTIFQEFFQVGNSERDRDKGLGLGLAIVKRLACILGHDLSIRSQPGRGSCFMLDLPMAGPPPEPPAHADDRETSQAGTVLVIDDETIVRDSLEMSLRDWGYEVLPAGDALEAVRWVTERGRCPDLIVADYRLREEHTGTHAVEEVHLACGHRIPTIILTGDTAPERIAEVESSGFHIAHKPVEPARLRTVMSEALRTAAV
jgi:PAS domain S-box-containing protein